MKKRVMSLLLAVMMVLALAGCADAGGKKEEKKEAKAKQGQEVTGKTDLADKDFDTSYQPKDKEYNIYATYKLVHNWYDAIEAGIKAAVAEFEEKGVKVEYVYEAPVEPDAIDQVNKIETAAGQGYDLIAVDVTQVDTTEAAVKDAIEAGVPVALFASSDLPNTGRSFFVGNTDNYGDGEALAEAVCEKMGGKGQIALLAGTIGAPSHEERLEAFHDVCAKYPDIEIVDEQRDNDFIEKAIEITEAWMQTYPELGGILCNNMSNPIGACQAVKDAGRGGEVVIGGMDHDLRSFNYLKDGTLYVAQVQNCYDMGYKLIYNAIKYIDGEEVDEITDVGSTSVYQDEAEKYIDLLY
ncbi:substrate-binding domain-containing protein [Extibacter muris]|uniref:substrate-binding domain-containing protein n=1 Tax=Extibacter muris TaxID=1796622 RepID=UPI001D069FC0|nr:substrate-binding domain-containing protein [Extibacter muris]MCB6203814.1 substrate-binding domain-containing protein [Extibacter muris]MCQ4665482.1 substrate-binding domain-containing protein [Extibacter muris]MCQ4695361.1 substrate-binding domain-containing protein [Extibacter muris]